MPSTIIDSAIFGDIFSTGAMRAVWSDENRTRKYLDIEAALARVQARLRAYRTSRESTSSTLLPNTERLSWTKTREPSTF